MTADLPWWREPTRAQYFAFFAAWLGWILDAFDFTVFLLVMPSIAKEFGVTVTSTAASITLTLVVRLAGSLVAGAVADRVGRRLPLMLSVIWFAVCDGLVSVAPSFTWVLVLRTLFGFGMGAEWTAGVTLAMESWPARSRAIASGLLQAGWAVGYLLAALAAALVLPAWGWRGLFLVGALPALLALPIRFFVKESPDFAPRGAPAPPPARGLAVRVAWAALVLGLGFGTYYAMASLYPTMLQKTFGFAPGEVGAPVAWFNVGMLVGAPLCGWLGHRFGPRAAIAVTALGVLPAAPLYVKWLAVPFAVGAFSAGLTAAGTSGITAMLLTSLFPAQVRARLTGVAYHLAALSAAFTPLWMAALVEAGATTYPHVIGLTAMGFALAQAVVVLAWNPARGALR